MKKIVTLMESRAFKNLLGDSFWTMFSQVFLVAVNLISVYILANLLSQHNYGEFKLITTWLAIALGVGYTGYNYLLPQKISRGDHYELGSIFRETFLKSLPTLAGLVLISSYYFYNQNLNLGTGFFFAGLTAPVLCISALVNIYYMGRRDFKMFALAQNFVDIIQLLIIALFAYLSQNFVVIISAYFLATIIANLLIITKVLVDDRKIKLSKQSENFQLEQTEIGLHEQKMKGKLNLSGIVFGFTYQLDKLFIFHFLGAVPLAVYSITTAMSDQARTPIKAVAAAVFPRMTAENFTKKKLLVAYGFLTLICIGIFVLLILLYPIIFKYLFPKYLEYIYLANIASITILFAPSQLLYLYAQGKNDLQTLNTYANINTGMQIVLYTISTLLGSIIFFLLSRSLMMFISTIYQFWRIYKK